MSVRQPGAQSGHEAGVEGQRATEAGFSLLELLVTFALLVVAVLLASALIEQSIKLMQQTGHSLRGPTVGTAAAWLRRDIEGSLSATRAIPGGGIREIWMAEALELHRADGATITVGRDPDGRLLRVQRIPDPVHPGQDLVDHRVLLRSISSWRCRFPELRLVDVEIELPVVPAPGGSPTAATRTERFRFALRGGSRW